MARTKARKATATSSQESPSQPPQKGNTEVRKCVPREGGDKADFSLNSGQILGFVGGVRPPKKSPEAAKGCLITPQAPVTVVPSANEDWTRFAAALALCLSDLQEGEFLIISRKGATHYVQFAARGRVGMRVEAACNAYIMEPQDQLSDEACVTMAQLGWHSPTMSPEESEVPHDPDGSPNFFQRLPDPVDFGHLAQIAVDTFRQVYHVSHLGMLQYKAFARGGRVIRFPRLQWQYENT